MTSEPVWQREASQRPHDLSVAKRWECRRKPRFGSAVWRYLNDERGLPDCILRTAIGACLLREGPYGSMWAAHQGIDGVVTGWEERGPYWRGFASGGTKTLFRLGSSDALRLCVTEAAIDAMRLGALECRLADTLYVSTGGGWSPATDAAIRALVAQPGVQLVAATDNNKQGGVFAERLLTLAGEAGCSAERLRPMADD